MVCPASSDESEHELVYRSMSPVSEEVSGVGGKNLEDVFTSESENSSVATCRTVRRVEPGTGDVSTISPSASQSFGSNLSLTVSETESLREKSQVSSNVGNGKVSGPVSLPNNTLNLRFVIRPYIMNVPGFCWI